MNFLECLIKIKLCVKISYPLFKFGFRDISDILHVNLKV